MAKKKISAPDDKERQKHQHPDYTEAHEQADKDIDSDPDLSTRPNPEDELDEGELARLEGED